MRTIKGVIYMHTIAIVYIFNIVFEITKFIAYLLIIKACLVYINKNKE